MSTNTDTKVNSYLTFQIGTEIFAADVINVINILEMTKITRVPKSPAYMKGVINLRGSVLPVLDTRLKFGLPETNYTTNTCILVLEINSKNEIIRLGAIVDSVQEVLEIGNEEVQPPPSIGTKFKTDILTGMVKKESDFIMILDINKVFADDEVINFKDISSDIK
jgi:purine-binding chemotaxis protein CheW